MNRISTEVYFHKGRWRFAVVQLGRLGQVIDRLYSRVCRNRKAAHQQALQALDHEKSKANPVLLSLCLLTCICVGSLVFPGCRKAPTPVAPAQQHQQQPTVPEEAVPGIPDYPFRAAVERTLTATSASGVTNMYVSGIISVVAALGMRLITGKWKDAGYAVAICAAASAVAVLLADFSGVVLIAPVALVVVLICVFIKRVVEWWTGYRAWREAATQIEASDTGPNSLGQRMKNQFKSAGLAPKLAKALEPLEAEWEAAGG